MFYWCRLVLLKVLNSILIVGQACIYISDDVQHEAQARLSHSKLVVVDPFEQRGNKIILISEDQSVDRSYSSSNYCSSRQSEKKNVGSDLSVDGDHKGFTPARSVYFM